MKVLIVGAGYVGFELAKAYHQCGDDVTGWVVSEESEQKLVAHGFKAIRADVAQKEAWGKYAQGHWDALIYCVSTRGGDLRDYENIHLHGLQNALEIGANFFCYTSSTSVYGQSDGSWVDENSAMNPKTQNAQVLLKAEERVLRAHGAVARLSGIYGQGRGFHFRRMMQGQAEWDGVGERWINQIHREDIIGAVQFLCTRRLSGVWNVSDDEPVRLVDFYQWIAQTYDRPMPSVVKDLKPRKRGDSNKRVLNQKIKEAGWRLKYPTFREGYAALAKERQFI